TLDRDVIGFRAAPTQRIPLAPVALLSDPLGVNPLSWETQVEAGTGPDVFRFDRATKSYVAGTDGLHEMTVVLDPNGNGCVLRLGVSSVSDSAARVDLGGTGAARGNGLLLDPSNNRRAVQTPAGGTNFATLAGALTTLRDSGEARVWPLYESCDPNTNKAVLRGFVAA